MKIVKVFFLVSGKELKDQIFIFFSPHKNRSHCLKAQKFEDKESDATTNKGRKKQKH